MLRAILSAHITSRDTGKVSIQLNTQVLGDNHSSEARNLVVSGNRVLHSACAHFTGRYTANEQYEVQETYQDFFREAQTYGLSYLPAFLKKHRAEADFLFFGSAELLLFFLDRQKGLYLFRDHRFYRLQPVKRPQGPFPDEWMRGGDFYSVTPKDNDVYLLISPAFLSQFRPEQLEELFSSKLQVHSVIDELSRIAMTYALNDEESWISLQIKRTENNAILPSKTRFLGLGEENDRIAMNREFASFFERSRVSRITVSQELLAAEKIHTSPQPRMPEKTVLPDLPHAKLGQLLHEERHPAASNPRLLRRKEKLATWEAYEARRHPREEVLDKMRDFSFDPLKKKGRAYWRRFYMLWPDHPLLSKVFASMVSILVVLLFLILIRFMTKKPLPESYTDVTLSTMPQEVAVQGIEALPPAETQLEVSWIVKANNLQLRQTPQQDSPLLASVKRGDVLIQLAPEEDDWVYVRTEDGREGYVYAPYLME